MDTVFAYYCHGGWELRIFLGLRPWYKPPVEGLQNEKHYIVPCATLAVNVIA